MKPTVDPSTPTCPEALPGGKRCEKPATVWHDNVPYCGHHAVQRKSYFEETLRRNGHRGGAA